MCPLPLKAILHTTEQLQVARKADILHIDATGGIIKKTIMTGKDILLFSIVPDTSAQEFDCVSVSDFLTERYRTQDLLYWLASVKCDMANATHSQLSTPLAYTIVVDMSWAIIHAAMLVFCDCVIQSYLETVFDALMKNVHRKEATIFICSSHFIANVARSISKYPKDIRCMFLSCFGRILTATSLHEAAEVWKEMNIIFGSTHFTQQLVTILEGGQAAATCTEEFPSEEEEVPKDDVPKGIRNASPFKHYFATRTRAAEPIDKEPTITFEDRNPYHCEEILQLALDVWLPLYGLWGAAVLEGRHRAHLTNAKVESWFA